MHRENPEHRTELDRLNANYELLHGFLNSNAEQLLPEQLKFFTAQLVFINHRRDILATRIALERVLGADYPIASTEIHEAEGGRKKDGEEFEDYCLRMHKLVMAEGRLTRSEQPFDHAPFRQVPKAPGEYRIVFKAFMENGAIYDYRYCDKGSKQWLASLQEICRSTELYDHIAQITEREVSGIIVICYRVVMNEQEQAQFDKYKMEKLRDREFLQRAQETGIVDYLYRQFWAEAG